MAKSNSLRNGTETGAAQPELGGDGGDFNDPSSADILLCLYSDYSGSDSPASDDSDQVQVYLHSSVLRRSQYFSALLSDRWRKEVDDQETLQKLNLSVSPDTGSIQNHIAVQLLYADDFSKVIRSPSTAILVIPVASKLLFEECVKHCVRYLEAVPWSEEEESEILNLVPFLSEEESTELLARVSISESSSAVSCEQMLRHLLLTVKPNHPKSEPDKASLTEFLREFPTKESFRTVSEDEFMTNVEKMRQSMRSYSSDSQSTKDNMANLMKALADASNLLWFVERMVEEQAADGTVKLFSQNDGFIADVQQALRQNLRSTVASVYCFVLIKITSTLAGVVADGSVVATREVRMNLVKHWFPMLITYKTFTSLHGHKHIHNNCPMSLCEELEETFLKIISTLPVNDAMELLQQCLTLTIQDSLDCQHLFPAFKTWFRRASLPLQTNDGSKTLEFGVEISERHFPTLWGGWIFRCGKNLYSWLTNTFF